MIERYPGGREKLDETIQGGELFQTIVYNPVSFAITIFKMPFKMYNILHAQEPDILFRLWSYDDNVFELCSCQNLEQNESKIKI